MPRFVCVRALSEHDCGPAALATVVRYYGGTATLDAIAATADTDRQGTELNALCRAAEELGFSASSGKVHPAAIDHLPLPAIVHLSESGGHFVVLYRLGADSALVADPARGLRRILRGAFDSSWSRSALLLRPGPHFVRRPPPHKTLRAFIALCVRDRGPLLAVAALGATSTIAAFAMAWVARDVFDELLPGLSGGSFVPLCIAAVSLVVASASAAAGRAWLLARIGLRIELSIGADYARRIFSRGLGFFLRLGAGDIFSRFADVAAVQSAVTGVALSMVFDSALLFGCSLTLAWFNPALAAVTIPFFVASCGCAALVLRRLMAAERDTRSLASEFAARFVECIMNVRAVKAYSAEQPMLDQLHSWYSRSRSSAARRTLLYQMVGAAVSLISGGGAAAVLLLGAHLAMQGRITTGELVMFYTGVGLAFGPMQRIAPSLAMVQAGLTGLERLAIAEHEPPSEGEVGLDWQGPAPRSIQIARVSHWYKPAHPVLSEIDLEITSGETLAIVGHTGCGKTTLVYLIASLARPSQGELLLDGKATSAYDLTSIRRHFVVASSDIGLIAGTIRENIAFGRSRAGDEEIQRVARRAGADEFVEQLPRKYEHRLGTGGSGLSSGQRQRLGVARALLRDPPFLLLDEATNALDPVAEITVIRAILESRRGRTTVLVSHRPSVAAIADRVVFMMGGGIAAVGRHADLIDNSPQYRDLWGVARPAHLRTAMVGLAAEVGC